MVGFYFFDSSALVKRYAREPGSHWVLTTLGGSEPINEPFVSWLTWVEILSALSRRRREGSLNERLFAQEVRLLRFHFSTQYRVADIDAPVVQLAGELVQRRQLRAADSIQLATALRLNIALASSEAFITFVSADGRLSIAADAEGLMVTNPLTPH